MNTVSKYKLNKFPYWKGLGNEEFPKWEPSNHDFCFKKTKVMARFRLRRRLCRHQKAAFKHMLCLNAVCTYSSVILFSSDCSSFSLNSSINCSPVIVSFSIRNAAILCSLSIFALNSSVAFLWQSFIISSAS